MAVGRRLAEESSAPTTESGPITVVLVDDQPLIRCAVRRALSNAGVRVVGEADAAETGVHTVLDLGPDVVLMDVVFCGAPAIEAIEQISQLAPASRILVLTTSTDRDYLVQAIVAGACGYILKDAGQQAIVKGVRASAAGECVIAPEVAGALLARIREREFRLAARDTSTADAIRVALTGRELEIFRRLASGETNQKIGQAFCLSENTVKNHVASILDKLHLDNRIQAAVHAVRSGLSCVAGLALLSALSDETNLTAGLVSFLVGA